MIKTFEKDCDRIAAPQMKSIPSIPKHLSI